MLNKYKTSLIYAHINLLVAIIEKHETDKRTIRHNQPNLEMDI